MNREFVVEQRSGATHVLLAGEIDISACPAIGRAIRRALDMATESVVIDLDAVTFIDSCGLGALVAGYHEAVADGRGFSIGPPAVPAVARVLTATLGDALVVPSAAEGDAAPSC
jgi:anti-sigma B factor antagonist